MTRKTDDLSLTREQTDLRIRRTARVASALVCVRVRRTGEVFSPARTRELGAVGGLLLLSGLVPPVAMLAAFPFVTSLVGEMAMSYSLVQPLATGDFICCAAGLLLMAVARMFEYGCILQRQDDETL